MVTVDWSVMSHEMFLELESKGASFGANPFLLKSF